MTTTNKTETALDVFITKTRDLFARQSDPDVRFAQLSPILAELLADPTTIAASKKWPDCHMVGNRPQNLLFYEDPDYKFVINALVVNQSGYSSVARIHDHGHVYTLYGLLDGTQVISRYERIDDGSKPDYAEIRPTFNSECAPGEIDLVRPFEIHAEDTTGQRAVAIIIRSESNADFLQGRFTPESNGYWQGYGPIQTPLPFFG
jgi:predicted metal-dependent enzyme (double-stranded beta helix superfamily)